MKVTYCYLSRFSCREHLSNTWSFYASAHTRWNMTQCHMTCLWIRCSALTSVFLSSSATLPLKVLQSVSPSWLITVDSSPVVITSHSHQRCPMKGIRITDPCSSSLRRSTPPLRRFLEQYLMCCFVFCYLVLPERSPGRSLRRFGKFTPPLRKSLKQYLMCSVLLFSIVWGISWVIPLSSSPKALHEGARFFVMAEASFLILKFVDIFFCILYWAVQTTERKLLKVFMVLSEFEIFI